MEAWSTILEFRKILLDGLIVTVELSAVMIAGGLILGALAAFGLSAKSKAKPVGVLKGIIRVYVEIFRGSPLLLQLFFGYYGLAYAGIEIGMMAACSIVMILYAGAYICEIIRSGIESIPKGQFEAGCCVGLTYVEVMRFIILPQAFRVFLPTLMGFFIGVVKDTSVVSLIGCTDLIRQARVVINKTGLPIQTYALVALIFFIICYPLSLYVRRLEKRRANE